jgi:hypothetical protein
MILVGMDAECIEAIEKKPVKLPTKMVQEWYRFETPRPRVRILKRNEKSFFSIGTWSNVIRLVDLVKPHSEMSLIACPHSSSPQCSRIYLIESHQHSIYDRIIVNFNYAILKKFIVSSFLSSWFPPYRTFKTNLSFQKRQSCTRFSAQPTTVA